MKRRLMSFVLSAAIVLSFLPPVEAAAADVSGVPDDFLKKVSQPLMPAAEGELYDEPAFELPDPSGSGFIAEVAEGEPFMPADGLMAEVGEAPAGATEIGTAKELAAISTKGTYILTADIDLTGVAWTPINLTATGSHIVLDGQGHTIKGLTVTATSESNYGLFGNVSGNVTVKNLRLDDVVLNLNITADTSTSNYGVGALFGSVKGTAVLDNVAADVTMNRTGAYLSRVGGLVGGITKGVTATDVAVKVFMPKADESLAGASKYAQVGGVIGFVSNGSSFTRCYAETSVNISNMNWNNDWEGASDGVGGMVGFVDDGYNETQFTDCLVKADIVATGSRAGGLLGNTDGGIRAANCVVEGDVTAAIAGGYAGYLQNYSTATRFVNCRYTGQVRMDSTNSAGHYAGGFAGYGSGTFAACAADVDLRADVTSGTVYLGGFVGWGSHEMASCAADVEMAEFVGETLYLGGLMGYNGHGNVSGNGSIRDCLVNVEATSLSVKTGNVGGIAGFGQYLDFINCGVTVQIAVAGTTAGTGASVGGLAGKLGGTDNLVKCWSDGVIDYHNEQGSSAAYQIGGLLGSGSGCAMSQCCGGVNITFACPSTGTSYQGQVGALAGSGGSMYSCWSDASITADGKTQSSEVGGLCGNSNGCTYRDCTFIGSLEGMNAKELGGILGSCQTAYFYNCYVEGNLEGGERVGGLLGQASHGTVFSDCKFEGSVTAMEGGSAGGIISAADDVLNGTATLRRCEVNADVTCPGGNAYGLAGPTKAYDCEFRGELSGANMGGIGVSGSFYDCIATVWFTADPRSAERMNVGGISSQTAAVASNCQVTNHLYLTVRMDENEDSLSIRFGGIGGIVTKAVDCTTKGVSLSCYGDDSELDEGKKDDKFSVYVGGIGGEMGRGMDNCRVEGSVSAYVTLGTIYVGGLAGRDISSSNGSSVTNCVTGGATGRLKKSTVYAGGLLGTGTDKTLISTCATGGGMAYCSENSNAAHSGKWTGNDKYDSGSKDLKIPERPEEGYTIQTYAYPDATETTNSTIVPLGGVTIKVGEKTIGKTNSAGMLTIQRKQVDSLNMKITGSKDGYFSADSGATLAGGGSTSLYLMKKTEGKIYLTSALYTRQETLTQTEKTMDLLSNPNSVVIPQVSTQPQKFFFGVDWNDADKKGRVLQLNNEAGSDPLELKDNEVCYLEVQEHFKPDETIYLEAKASFGGTEVTERLKLNLKVRKVEIDMDPPGGSGGFGEGGKERDGTGGLEFLDGAGLKIDLENLSKLSGVDVRYENGVLTVEMNVGKTACEETALTFDTKFELQVGGKVRIPFSEEANGTWSGDVRVAINADLESDSAKNNADDATGDQKKAASDKTDGNAKDKKKKGKKPVLDWRFPTTIGPVPVTFIINFDGSVYAEMGFGGEFDKVTYTSTIGFEPQASIVLRLGGDLGPEMKFYVDGGGEMKAPIAIVMQEALNHDGDDVDVIMSAEGRVYAAITAKGGELVDVSMEKNLGRFTWNTKDGAKWYNWNNEEIWTASERAYLAAGGGFTGITMENMLTNLAVYNGWKDASEKECGDQRLVYENIQNGSTAALGIENGVPVLYFTADDGQNDADGTISAHTALWRTERQSDGTWGIPAVVSEGGYPDEVRTGNGYAVWVESEQTDSFDALLTSTDIKIAHNGEVIHTIDGQGYVYAPEITADTAGNILVVWLSDPGVNGETFFTSSNNTLQYALYDAAAAVWLTGTAKTTGMPLSTALDIGAIYTSDAEGKLYRISGAEFGTCSEYLPTVESFDTVGTYTASISEDGVLTIWQGTTAASVIELGTTAFSNPVVRRSGEDTYVIWAQNDGVYYADSTDGWAKVKQVCEEDGMATRLTAEIVDGRPLVSYYRSENMDGAVATHLISAYAEDISGTDLVLSDLELDSRGLGELDVVRVLGTVTNQMETAQSGYTYLITDESGAEAAAGTVVLDEALGLGDSAQLCVVMGHDVTVQHTYNVTVTPLTGTDANAADNTAAVTAYAESVLAGTSFRKTHEGVELEALVKNVGAAPEDDLTVEVYRADLSGNTVGKALLSETVSGLLPGSYRQILLPGTESDVYYKVAVLDGEEELDSELLMWSDPEVSGVWAQKVEVNGDGSAEVTLNARNYREDMQMHLALYQSGRMVANAMTSLEAWDGNQTVELDLGELSEGEYACAVYLLRQKDLNPVMKKYTDTLIVE